MNKIQPFNNIILGRILSKEESSIVLPNTKEGRFVRIEVIAVGKLVEDIKSGDIVIANNMFEIIDPRDKDIGFINSRDVLGKEIRRIDS